MSTTPPVTSDAAAGRHGFVIVIDTLFQGTVISTWDEHGQPVFFDTRAEADAEVADSLEQRKEAVARGDMEDDGDDDENGEWVEPAELHPDGSLVLTDMGVTWTALEISGMR